MPDLVKGGSIAADSPNAYEPNNSPANGDLLYFGADCKVQISPEWLNQWASEIVAVVDGLGGSFDLNSQTNLLDAINAGLASSEIYVDGAAWDAANLILKLTDNSGATSDISVDLGSIASKVTVNNSTSKITHVDGKGQTNQWFRVSQDAGNKIDVGTDGGAFFSDAEIYVDGATWDAANLILKLTDNSGSTSDISVDLGSIASKVTVNNSTSKITHVDGKGQTNQWFRVSQDAGNNIEIGTDGGAFIKYPVHLTGSTTTTTISGLATHNGRPYHVVGQSQSGSGTITGGAVDLSALGFESPLPSCSINYLLIIE